MFNFELYCVMVHNCICVPLTDMQGITSCLTVLYNLIIPSPLSMEFIVT